jgi:hypothetical protein
MMVGKESPQQSAVYRAQARCSRGESFPDVESAQKYVYRVMASEWWGPRNYSKLLDGRGIAVQSVRGACSVGCSKEAAIGLCKGGFTEGTVLHEIAHVVTGGEHGHTGPFVRTMLELTYLVRGQAAYAELSEALVAEGVDIG